MSVVFNFSDQVAVVTGSCGALGSAVAAAFADAGATVAACDIVDIDSKDSLLESRENVAFYQADFTDEAVVAETIDQVVSDHGQIDCLVNVAGTWRGGDPVEETDTDLFEMLFDINLKTMFLATKHALPALQATEGSVVSVSARSGLEGGTGDGVYRATKASVRIMTETVAEENLGTVRANCVMPSVLDTPMNREIMTPSDKWVAPADVAEVILFLCSDAASVTSGASIPVYGEA